MMFWKTPGNNRAILPVLAVLAVCSIIFGGVQLAVSAQVATANESAAQETTVAEKTTLTTDAVVIGEETAIDVKSELEKILKKNSKCLRCHGREKTKLLEDGQEMSLQVHKEDYLDSAHGEVSCTSCHTGIGSRKHPSKKTNISISSERDYSVEMNESCRQCHSQKYKQYKGSVHSALVAQGSEKAPVCTSCHNPHAPVSMANYQAETGLPCKNCHENIFNAYSVSVHGQGRINGNTIRDSPAMKM